MLSDQGPIFVQGFRVFARFDAAQELLEKSPDVFVFG
jgi:hypothetical protein